MNNPKYTNIEIFQKSKQILQKLKNSKISHFLLSCLKIFTVIFLIKMIESIVYPRYFLKVLSAVIINKNIHLFLYTLKTQILLNCNWIDFGITLGIYFIINTFINNKKRSLIIITALTYLYGLINCFVYQSNGSYISISDLHQIHTALGLTSGYNFHIDICIFLSTILFVLTIFIIFKLYKNNFKENIKIRISKLVLSIISFVFIVNSNAINEINYWSVNDCLEEFGPELTTIAMSKDAFIKAPQNYDKEGVQTILNNYKDDENKIDDKPNIIVIVDESFADLSDSNLDITQDNIPYFHSLKNQKNTISGIMHSSYLGKGTANIEYEFLTQNTIAFLPKMAIVFQQYINNNINSFVSRMNNLDYKTYGIHTWKNISYNRKKVYNYLQFQNIAFKEDFDDLENYNNLTTDKSSFSKIINILENKNDGETIFSYNLTMQNHSPYNTDDSNLPKYSTVRSVNSYMQKEHLSDEALKDLISYLENYNEKVILLFFGDHKPKVDGLETDSEHVYEVPYLFWANYDIEEKDYGDISTIYLSSILSDIANLPKDKYTKYIEELRQDIPIITANYYIDKNGNKYELNDETSPYHEKIKEYEKIVYYQIFDNK